MDTEPKVIAVAVDDPDDLILLKEAFDQCGWNVRLEFLDTGAGLLDFLGQHGDHAHPGNRAHMILMDFHLPQTNALDLIGTIKSDPGLKRIPLIVLAGYCRDTDVLNCYDLGANTVISKPHTFGELLQSVKRMCDYWFGVAGG
jgi:CheY-like chemotaxis protein